MRLTVRFRGETAEDAQRQAVAWARNEPHIRLRTVARVDRALTPDGTWAGGSWDVVLVVAETGNNLSENELIAAYGGLPADSPIG